PGNLGGGRSQVSSRRHEALQHASRVPVGEAHLVKLPDVVTTRPCSPGPGRTSTAARPCGEPDRCSQLEPRTHGSAYTFPTANTHPHGIAVGPGRAHLG